MVEDNNNKMHFCNRSIPRPSGSEQASNVENANEQQLALPAGLESSRYSAPQEPSLVYALRQMIPVPKIWIKIANIILPT